MNDKQVNDFAIPCLSFTDELENLGQHFKIFFDTQDESYYIRDLGIGFGCYVNVNEEISILDGHMFKIGETDLVFNMSGSKDGPILRMRIYGDSSTGEVFYFKPDETKSITIGRD